VVIRNLFCSKDENFLSASIMVKLLAVFEDTAGGRLEKEM